MISLILLYLREASEQACSSPDGVWSFWWLNKTSLVSDADVPSFAVNTDWPLYARDNKHVYVYGQVIGNADPSTFVALCGASIELEEFCAYGKDQNHVFAYTQIIPKADPNTFVSLVSNNSTNKENADKGWTDIAIDSSSYYENYVPINLRNGGDVTGLVDGDRIVTLNDSTPIHFENPAQVIAVNSNTVPPWTGYRDGLKIGTKHYYGATYLVEPCMGVRYRCPR